MLSAADAVQRAFDWTRKVLFAPFDLGKWCVMGFTLFLAHFFSGGGNGFQARNPWRGFSRAGFGTSPLAALSEVRDWVLLHLPLVTLLGTLLLALILVFQWLGARGQFMFLDNVVNDRARVAEPWNRYRQQGNRVFLFRILLDACGLALLALCAWMGWRIGRFDLMEMRFTIHFLRAVLVILAVALPVGFVLAMVDLVLRDFVIPVMYVRGCNVGEAFGVLWVEVVRARTGAFVLFYLLKLGLFLAAAILITFVTCLTCCAAAIPYVSSVVFLPVDVFFRSYSLAFLGQAGAEWDLLARPADH